MSLPNQRSLNLDRERRNFGVALARLTRAVEKDSGQAARSLGIAIGERTLSVRADRCALAAGRAGRESRLTELTRQFLALQVKALSDIERSQASRDGKSPCRGSLVYDAASCVLLEEDLEVYAEEQAGVLAAEWIQQVKSMRYELASRRREVLELLGDDVAVEVDGAVNFLRDFDPFVPPPTDETANSDAGQGRRRRARAKAQARRAGSRRSGGRRRLVVAAVCSVVLAFASLYVAMNYSTWLQRPSSGVLDIDDFAGIASIQEIEDRPPSVFLTVDPLTWGRLSEDQRTRVVTDTRSVLGRYGYQGALFYTPEGDVVAQWAPHSGSIVYASE